MLLNKQVHAKIAAGELCDRSQKGNKSYLRNEKYSGGAFTWSPDYVLPTDGWLEFDFIYLTPIRPVPEEELHPDEMSQLLAWFQQKYAQFQETKGQNPNITFDGGEMAQVFSAISEQFVFSTQ